MGPHRPVSVFLPPTALCGRKIQSPSPVWRDDHGQVRARQPQRLPDIWTHCVHRRNSRSISLGAGIPRAKPYELRKRRYNCFRVSIRGPLASHPAYFLTTISSPLTLAEIVQSISSLYLVLHWTISCCASITSHSYFQHCCCYHGLSLTCRRSYKYCSGNQGRNGKCSQRSSESFLREFSLYEYTEFPIELQSKPGSKLIMDPSQLDIPKLTFTPSSPPKAAAETGLPPSWEVRHSNSKNLPYYFNIATKESRWEPPPGTDSNLIKQYMAVHHSSTLSGAGAGTVGGGSKAGKIRAAHLLVKHRDSRRPSSWKEQEITRTKEEALEILRGFERRIQAGEIGLQELAIKESDCSSARKKGDLYVSPRLPHVPTAGLSAHDFRFMPPSKSVR